jgi:Fe-S oxidoreductase
MATYKAEFRAHHYRARLYPRAAYSMGLVHEWSRLAAKMPALTNAVLHAPGLSALLKGMAGIAQERRIPRYAKQSFVQWFRGRSSRRSGRRVILWPDTFNNYFRPTTAIAATHVLETLGFEVAIPGRPLCCGRPLYDWGMLERAKAQWREIIHCLQSDIDRGTIVIGLEPACVSAFRDELIGLFPNDTRAKKLANQMLLFTEFLDRHVPDVALPRVDRAALVQIHCHHHAVIKTESEAQVLNRLGLDYEIMRSGCCGMAGAFGFEKAKYQVSMKAAERVLLPKVRAAPPETIVLANGFSCREQIEQALGRKTTHIAELIANSWPLG